jgi:hypothetical protein
MPTGTATGSAIIIDPSMTPGGMRTAAETLPVSSLSLRCLVDALVDDPLLLPELPELAALPEAWPEAWPAVATAAFASAAWSGCARRYATSCSRAALTTGLAGGRFVTPGSP